MKFDAPIFLESLPKTPKAALRKGVLIFPPFFPRPDLDLYSDDELEASGKVSRDFAQYRFTDLPFSLTYSKAMGNAYLDGDFSKTAELIPHTSFVCDSFNLITLRVLSQKYIGCDDDYFYLSESCWAETWITVRSACDINLAALKILEGKVKDALERLRLCPFEEILADLETSTSVEFYSEEARFVYDGETPEALYEEVPFMNWPADRVAIMAFNFAFLLFHGLGVEADEQAAVNLYKRIRTYLPRFLYVAPPLKESMPSVIRDRALNKAWDEVESGNRKEALWRKLWMKNKGDESKTKFDYIEARINQISKKEAG